MSGLQDITANLENSRNCLRRIARHDEQQFSKDSLVNVMEKFVKTVNYMDETILVPCRLMDRQVGDATDIIPIPKKTSSSLSSSHYAHIHMSGNSTCRKDRQQTVYEFLNSADLFNLYNMLNSLKNDLLWTRNDVDECNAVDSDSNMINTTNIITTSTNATISSATAAASSSSQTAAATTTYNNMLCSSTSTLLNDQDIGQTSSSNLRIAGSSNEVTPSTGNNTTTASSSTTNNNNTKGHIRRPSTASMTSSNSVSNLSDSESEISNENDSGIESEGNCGDKDRKCNGNLDKATELARQCRTHLSGLYRCLEQMTEAANYLTARYQSDVGPV